MVSPPSPWSCTVSSAASCPAPARCWARPPARRSTARRASGGWTTHRPGGSSPTWAAAPRWGWCPTPASPCCCRSPSTSSGRATTPSTWCGARSGTWGRTGRASCTTCCGRRRRTTPTHASTSPRRTGWTTATWSSRRRRERQVSEALHTFTTLTFDTLSRCSGRPLSPTLPSWSLITASYLTSPRKRIYMSLETIGWEEASLMWSLRITRGYRHQPNAGLGRIWVMR